MKDVNYPIPQAMRYISSLARLSDDEEEHKYRQKPTDHLFRSHLGLAASTGERQPFAILRTLPHGKALHPARDTPGSAGSVLSYRVAACSMILRRRRDRLAHPTGEHMSHDQRLACVTKAFTRRRSFLR
jgi:hypothetical protein